MVDVNNRYKPNIAIPPGETLKEVLESQNMTQKEFAERVELSKKTVNQIIKGIAPITPETALKFESVFGIPASFWNNLERNYQETDLRLKTEKELEKEKEILKSINYSDLVKLHWVKEAKTIKDKILNLRSFLSVSSLKLVPNVYNAAFRKTKNSKASPFAIAAWIEKGVKKANEIETEPFDKKKIISCINNFRSLTLKKPEEFVPRLISDCASCGIALVILPYLPKTHANGATKWLNSKKALLLLNNRFRFIDIFWFTFFHELGHLILDSKKDTFIDLEKENKKNNLEKKPDEFAANTLIPRKDYEKFISLDRDLNEESIFNFAESIGIHSAIIIGRLEYDGLISHAKFNHLKPRLVFKEA